MRIIIDAMGGDNAPAEIVKGAVDARREFGVDITLVGRKDDVISCLNDCQAADDEGITIVNAEEVITMHDDPSTAIRAKRDSSMAVALKMLKNDEGDACISAGNTGALLSGATLLVKRIPGIRRASLAPIIPNGKTGVLLIDSGANAECSEEYLLQFAYMGSFYAGKMMGVENPRVALLNIGAEDTKGGELQKRTYALLKEAGDAGRINFVGNVEGGDVFSNMADVIVTDGFSGNILLKTIEGTAKFVMKNIKGIFASGEKGMQAAMLIKNELGALQSMLDASEVGGTPLLGVQKPVIKAHGSSNARAIRSAVKQAIAFVNAGFIDEINANIEYMKLHTEE
jgi:glycerol-3-phosphate acyltransferase PlsX